MPRKVLGAINVSDQVLWCAEKHLTTAKYRLQQALNILEVWTKQWPVKINPRKTIYTIFSLCVYAHACVCACMYECMCAWVHVCLSACMCMCVCKWVCIQEIMHTCIHTHTHTHTHKSWASTSPVKDWQVSACMIKGVCVTQFIYSILCWTNFASVVSVCTHKPELYMWFAFLVDCIWADWKTCYFSEKSPVPVLASDNLWWSVDLNHTNYHLQAT